MSETIMQSDQALTDEWADVLAAPVGHIFLDRHEDGLRFLIMRGPAAVCAYVGVPESHPLAGKGYDDLPVDCHGGLTYSSLGGGEWPESWWWYGWDYAHSGDYATYNDEHPVLGQFSHSDETKWTPAAVDKDSWNALYSFKKLMRLAESIRPTPSTA